MHNRRYVYFSDIDNYEHICVSDREELLSQIYELLRLEQADDEDPTRISSPTDREKLRLAKQIAHDHTFKRSQSSPVASFLPSIPLPLPHRSPPIHPHPHPNRGSSLHRLMDPVS